MNLSSAPISDRVVLRVIDVDGTVSKVVADLHFDPLDPYAVSIRFHAIQGIVTWRFARDLLLDGAVEPTGEGDVHVWPSADEDGESVVFIDLDSPHGSAVLLVSADELASFNERMVKAVPLGEESSLVNLDAVITAILTAV